MNTGCFGWTAMVADRKRYDKHDLPKVRRYEGPHERFPRVRGSGRLGQLLRLARKVAKGRGLSLEEYLRIPRQQRPV